MSNKFMKAVSAKFREVRIKDGYYDGRFVTKSVPNKRLKFLSECDDDFDEFVKDEWEPEIKPSSHRL